MKKKYLSFIIFSIFNFSNYYLFSDSHLLPRAAQLEKRLAVIITTYNNQQFCKKNLESLFSQNYHNYYTIIIDDASEDRTAEIIEDTVKKYGKENSTILIKNKIRKGKIANLYNALHNYCHDTDIAVIYDGDDWFHDKGVFSYLNTSYTQKNIWLTYGGYEEYPYTKREISKPISPHIIKNNTFRNHHIYTSQLRTFYAWLFKSIPLEEFLYEGKFMKMTSDIAKMMPMLEKAGDKIQYNSRKVYIYNLANNLNDHKVNLNLQLKLHNYIKSRPKFTKLDKPIYTDNKKKKADLIVFSKNVNNIQPHLKNIESHFTDINNAYIIIDYYITSEELITLQKKFDVESKKIKPIIIQLTSNYALSHKLYSLINSSTQEYLIITKDNWQPTQTHNISSAIKALEKTKAYSFHLDLIQPKVFEYIEDNLYAYQFKFNQDVNKLQPLYFYANIYKKEDIINKLTRLSFNSIKELKKLLKKAPIDLYKTSLFITTA